MRYRSQNRNGSACLENEQTSRAVRCTVEDLYRAESRRVFATLVRLLGDFDLAEEALHDAFQAALEQWPGRGVPESPRCANDRPPRTSRPPPRSDTKSAADCSWARVKKSLSTFAMTMAS